MHLQLDQKSSIKTDHEERRSRAICLTHKWGRPLVGMRLGYNIK
jgi:hypothetical protein